MQAMIAFENSPPFFAPVRFFLTAPLFAAAAGLLMIAEGGALFLSRWSMSTLTLVHLLTVGFMLMVMLGALFQVLPVVAGAAMARPRALSRGVHGLLTLGALLLCAGFYRSDARLLAVAALVLGSAVLVFVVAAGVAMRRVRAVGPTVQSIRWALAGLVATVVLGGVIVATMNGAVATRLPVWVDVHAGTGLLGWCVALIMAVSYVVVPMFQLTPGYPARLSQTLVPALALALIFWATASFVAGAGHGVAVLPALAAVVTFAVATLRLQARSKRAALDVTARYWRLGMAGFLLAATAWLVRTLGVPLLQGDTAVIAIGTVAVVAGLMPVMAGMLLKIVPFLAWMHLQQEMTAAMMAGRDVVPVPNMKQLLADVAALRQYRAALVLLGLLALAPLLGDVGVRLAGVALVTWAGLLGALLLGTARQYRALSRRLAGVPAPA